MTGFPLLARNDIRAMQQRRLDHGMTPNLFFDSCSKLHSSS
ncbi:MAG: hypothetical protein ACEY3D_06530 [Rickettsia sp.]